MRDEYSQKSIDQERANTVVKVGIKIRNVDESALQSSRKGSRCRASKEAATSYHDLLGRLDSWNLHSLALLVLRLCGEE